MKKLFIGIDVSKDFFDYCILHENHEVFSSKNVEQNTLKGIKRFCKYVQGLTEYDPWICLENTGRYGALLCSEFAKTGLTFSQINPLEIKYSIGLTRGKNDSIDAFRIASYAATNQYKLQAFKLSGQDIQKLKAVMSLRDAYVKVCVQLKNTLKSLLVLSKSLSVKEQISMTKSSIKKIEGDILRLEKQLLEIINSNNEIHETFDKISTVIGIGPITAVKCITETDNFNKFKNARKFSCHCGLAPFEHSSGSSVRGRTKTSKMRCKDLKAILFNAAGSAIQHDPQLKSYYNRKVGEGKNKLSVMNAVANKLVLRIFAVANRNEPFVKLYA